MSHNGTTPPTADELAAQVEQKRQELGETVDALSARLDVKARSREKVQQARQRVTEQATRAREAATDENGRPTQQAVLVGAAGAGLLAGVVVLALWRRRS